MPALTARIVHMDTLNIWALSILVHSCFWALPPHTPHRPPSHFHPTPYPIDRAAAWVRVVANWQQNPVQGQPPQYGGGGGHAVVILMVSVVLYIYFMFVCQICSTIPPVAVVDNDGKMRWDGNDGSIITSNSLSPTPNHQHIHTI